MHRAYDPGETIREKGLNAAARLNSRISHDSKREMENGVSRSSLVHGTQTNPNSDTWYDTDAFLLDQVKEVLNKLNEGSIDDEIWGKIVIMERCKRVAKAYLRKTTVIIDGSEDEFDGKTLGFNHFENPTRDDHTKEIRAKIADGVILKMDYQGNIKGMARGATPIVCQGWKEPRNNCISDRLVRLHGKLNHGAMEDEKAYKVFDMRKFKHSLERELHDGTPDARNLLLKTCMRVALVKDGADMNRTPCWFAIVNLVALDMIKEKIPLIKSLLNVYGLPSVTSPSPMSGPDNSGFNAQTLTQIIAAAVTQANKGTPTPTRNNNNNNQNLTISPEQLAQIASTISIAQTNTLRTADLVKKERPKKPYHCSTSSLDSSGEDSSGRRSEASTAIKSRAKRWEQVQKINEIEKYTESPAVQMLDKPRAGGRAHRPLLQDVIFTRSHSITSDYDSNKEHFDSGSWSSTQSRYKDGRSTSSSVVSEHELAALARDELKETSEIREANAVSEDDEPPTNPPSPAPTVNVPTLPRKDYNQSPAHTPEHVCPLPRSFSSTPAAEQFLPTLEGAPVWTPSAVSTASELSPPIPMSSPPPPLPRTPQPNNGLPNASLPYNQINNAFNSNPAFYERHHEMREFHPHRGEEMEVYFGRSPVQSDPPRNRSNPFVSELRQVLEKRTSGLRIARNHSQPATVHPNLRQFGNARQPHHGATQPYNNVSSNCSSGRNTPERAHSQHVASSSHQAPRGLRRTHNQQYQHQSTRDQQQPPATQRLPPYNYGQSTLCREPASVAVRVSRTGSLPWGQYQHVRRTHM
ncbi:MH2 domain-containing protein [Caenorhabditis elegans]|uniref:MH2 domain-containing protein n=1 Tax=Caenorhabditis elegans TaxID=6239 RepID=A0A4V6M3C5_CAEEL|nr:MH2 domain-containing protein [Caenorhabditis elegans]VTW47501.1 MH2 domain-containing protein [Caenorhabditis elegans]